MSTADVAQLATAPLGPCAFRTQVLAASDTIFRAAPLGSINSQVQDFVGESSCVEALDDHTVTCERPAPRRTRTPQLLAAARAAWEEALENGAMINDAIEQIGPKFEEACAEADADFETVFRCIQARRQELEVEVDFIDIRIHLLELKVAAVVHCLPACSQYDVLSLVAEYLMFEERSEEKAELLQRLKLYPGLAEAAFTASKAYCAKRSLDGKNCSKAFSRTVERLSIIADQNMQLVLNELPKEKQDELRTTFQRWLEIDTTVERKRLLISKLRQFNDLLPALRELDEAFDTVNRLKSTLYAYTEKLNAALFGKILVRLLYSTALRQAGKDKMADELYAVATSLSAQLSCTDAPIQP